MDQTIICMPPTKAAEENQDILEVESDALNDSDSADLDQTVVIKSPPRERKKNPVDHTDYTGLKGRARQQVDNEEGEQYPDMNKMLTEVRRRRGRNENAHMDDSIHDAVSNHLDVQNPIFSNQADKAFFNFNKDQSEFDKSQNMTALSIHIQPPIRGGR